jgi:hypothetical protein
VTGELVVNAVAAAALGAATLALGNRLRRLLRIPLPPGLRVSASLALGAGALAIVVTCLALTGALSVYTLVSLVFIAAAAGRWRGTGPWRPLLGPALAALVVTPVALAPPFFYDAMVYHLALPWQALLEGGWTAHPENLFSSFPPLAQCLASVPLALGLDRVPALVHLVMFVAAAAPVRALSRGLGAPPLLADLAAASLVVLPSHALVPGLPAAEAWMLAPLAVACALALRANPHPSWLAMAGILAGIAAGARVQALPWGVGLTVLLALRSRRTARGAAHAGIGWLAAASPWWFKNLVLLGAPLSPLGVRREGTETLWRDGASGAYLADSLAGAASHAHAALVPLLPFVAPLALLAVLALWQRRRPQHAWCVLSVIAGTAAWTATGALPRFFAMTAVPLLAAAAAPRRGPGRWAAWGALAVVGATGLAWNVGEINRLGGVAMALEPGETVRSRLVVNDPSPAFTAARRLAGDTRVLFVGEPRGLPFPRPFVAPSQHDVSPLRAHLEDGGVGAALKWLNERGFTHLLVNRGELARLAPGYPVMPYRTPVGARRWAELLDGLGPPIVEARGVVIYSLAPRN